MNRVPDFLSRTHDARDPDPWLALYLDRSTPLDLAVKRAWLSESSSKSRQFLLPLVRPLARAFIVLIQIARVLLPKAFDSSKTLHRVLVWGLKTWVRPEANWLILRHFHIGSENLDFIARNVPGVNVPLSPLRPRTLDDLKDDLFLKHDLNLYNFIINLNLRLAETDGKITPVNRPDFSGITVGELDIGPLPNRWTNFVDLETAIEMFTPLYQLFMTDGDFWRSVNSLQLDETIGLYVARILGMPEGLFLINNKHPLVPLSTLRAGHRLVLHGLASEMLHTILANGKRAELAKQASTVGAG